ncbi:AAA family ATPase [Luteitalea sp.]
MRLVSLEISGFRGFPLSQHFDFDADAVIVVGANGHGKTSLFDALLWALTGRIPRLGDDSSRVVSMYAESGIARAALTLRSPRGGDFTITRSFDGKDARVAIETNEKSYQGPSAEGRIIEVLWPDAANATDPLNTLAGVITKSVYLQQDLVRQFIEAATDHDRFAAVSELVGAGRVTELQVGLERAKRAWSSATNQRADEARALQHRLNGIDSRIADATASASKNPSGLAPEAWNEWWENATGLGITTPRVSFSSREAPGAIDAAIKEIDALQRLAERRVQSLLSLDADIQEDAQHGAADVDLEPLRARVAMLQTEHAQARQLVEGEQARLAEIHRLQAELKEKSEQLSALASLALKHLEERCPVCGQTYDRDSTHARLSDMARTSLGRTGESQEDERLTELLAALEATRKQLSSAEDDLRTREQARQQRELAIEGFRKRAQALGVDAGGGIGSSALKDAIAAAMSSKTRLSEMHRSGEALALGLAHASRLGVLEELRYEAKSLRGDIEKREKDLAARNRTGEQAQRVIEALREAGSAVVQERLRQIEPVLQDVYTRIDPHPAFRVVTFLSRIVRGKGQLSTVITDPVEQKDSEHPSTVLSSSQVNALAVSVFLALNLGIPNPPLALAMLDDPLQSLDDINLLGLVDLLRRTKDRRQLLVSTHDVRFGGLLARKLRPRSADGRTVVIDLEGWSRKGPSVSTRVVASDPVPLRLVAAAG